MKTLFVLLALSSSVAYAKSQDCNFKLDCEQDKTKFSIEFKSKADECSEDDSIVTFTAGKESRRLELKPRWFFFNMHIAKNLESVCHEGREPFAAYPAGPHQTLLFINQNNRPSYRRILAVLLDNEEGQVLDSQDLGESKNEFLAVLPFKKGFKTRLVRDSLSFHKEVTCDCDAPFVDDWMTISIKNGKIVNGWLKK